MRYIEITHTYIVPVPTEDVDAIEVLANTGVSMMENFMRNEAANIRELRSDWKMMPKEFSPKFDSEVLRSEVKRGPSIPHPWDSGLRVVPEGHPLFEAETVALKEEGMLCGEERNNLICAAVKGHPGDHTWVPKVGLLDA